MRCGAECGTLTLGLREVTLLNTGLEGAVEQRVEHGVGSSDLVVGLDILLQALTAIEKVMLEFVLSQCGLSHPKPESRWLHASPVRGA